MLMLTLSIYKTCVSTERKHLDSHTCILTCLPASALDPLKSNVRATVRGIYSNRLYQFSALIFQLKLLTGLTKSMGSGCCLSHWLHLSHAGSLQCWESSLLSSSARLNWRCPSLHDWLLAIQSSALVAGSLTSEWVITQSPTVIWLCITLIMTW